MYDREAVFDLDGPQSTQVKGQMTEESLLFRLKKPGLLLPELCLSGCTV